MQGAVLVIGGGIAGIQSSLDLSELGFKVFLVERTPSIGGRVAQLDRVFPTNRCSLCILAPKMIEIFTNPNIELLTYTEIQKVTGKPGNFVVTVLKKPRYVDETKCKGCGDCATKCPKIEAPNIFDMNLGKRKSIYIPFLQAIPPVYLIDPTMCLFLNKGVCKVCSKVCQTDAIDYEQKPQLINLKVGAIVVATGFDILGEELSPKWGYQHINVINGLEYERMLCAAGPFGGKILRPSDEKEPKLIAFIQCAGSRDLQENVSYCSSVCCMYTAKQAITTKEHLINSQCFVFRDNIIAYGKNYYEFIQNAKEEYDMKYFHSKISKIEEDPENNDLNLYYEDLNTGEPRDFRANLVILATPLVPSNGTKKLAKVLGIEIDKYDFFKEKSYFNKTLSTREGIFLCGACQDPMDISETVADASNVASQIGIFLNSVKYSQIKEKKYYNTQKDDIIKITPTALIIGGGVSGMTAALNIANQGFKTYIVEKEKKLGGNLNNLYILHPIQQKASQFLDKIKEDVEKNNNIQIFLDSKVMSVKGYIGNYNVSIANSKENVCDLQIGTIIVATGSQESKPNGIFQYSDKNQNVITQLELEKKLKDGNKTWLHKIKCITMILCANAKQKEGITYCSNVCCINAIKNIKILKELKPGLEIKVLYRDLQMAKKVFEDYYRERKDDAIFMRYDLNTLPEIIKTSIDPERYELQVFDSKLNNFLNFETDFIVLSTPMIPADNLEELTKILKVPLDENGFFLEAHSRLRPLDFATDGIFLCGCAHWPKNVQESISQANGAAGRASRFLSIKKITSSRLKFRSFLLSLECFYKDLEVNIEKCNGCGKCEEICLFHSIERIDITKEFEDVSLNIRKSIINSAICKGCGRCAVICPVKAISARHYDLDQISTIIDSHF